MKPFAEIDDYVRRYGREDAVDYLLLEECLKDASRKVAALLEKHGIDWKKRRKKDKDYAERMCQVVRDMAHRAVQAEANGSIPFAATQFQESADGFSSMASFSSGGYGELYITKSEKDLLGVGIQKLFTIEPKGLHEFAKKVCY